MKGAKDFESEIRADERKKTIDEVRKNLNKYRKGINTSNCPFNFIDMALDEMKEDNENETL